MTFVIPTHSVSAPAFEASGNVWEPQAHFTGHLGDTDAIIWINRLVVKYGSWLTAHYLYSPLPNCFSLELQFSNEDRAVECIREYERGFTPNGKLKASAKALLEKEKAMYAAAEAVLGLTMTPRPR